MREREQFGNLGTGETLALENVLTNLPDGLRRDATVLRVIGHLQVQAIAEDGFDPKAQLTFGLWRGPEGLVNADVGNSAPNPASPSDEAAYMYWYGTEYESSGITTINNSMALDPGLRYDIRSQRRFAENFQTIYLVLQFNNLSSGATNMQFTVQAWNASLLLVP